MHTELSRRQITIRALLIALLAALPFLPTLAAGFPWDEIRAMDGASRFIMPAEHFYARPLAVMVLGWERALMGGWAPGYHVFSILLHMSNAVLFYHIARRMIESGNAAVFSGAMFGMFPLHAEALGLVAGQAVLLGGLFGISSFLLYLVYARKGYREALVAGALFSLVGMLAWQAVLMIPLMVLAHAFASRIGRKPMLETLYTYGAAVALYVLFFGGNGEIFNEAQWLPGQLGRISFAMGYHVMKLAAPVGVVFAKPLIEEAAMILPVVGALAAAALLWAEGLRRESLLLFAALLLILPAALAASFEPNLRAWFRHSYLGAAGISLFAGALLGRLLRGRWFLVAGVPLIIAFAASAVHASLPWRDMDRLWRRAAIENPYSAMPMLNLSAGAIASGLNDKSRDYLARTITFRDMSRDDILAAMRLYADIGGANDEPGLLGILSTQRGKADALMGMGAMHMELYHKARNSGAAPQGKAHLDRAIEYFGLAAAENPEDPVYHYNLGVAHVESGDLAEAQSDLVKVVAMETDAGRRLHAIRTLKYILTQRGVYNQPGHESSGLFENSPAPVKAPR